MTMRTIRIAVVAASLVAGLALIAAGPPPQSPQDAAAETPSWTADDCAACHESEVAGLAVGPHAAPPGWTAATSCAACHGDPTAHVEAAGEAPIQSFGPGTPMLERLDTCRTCHADTHPLVEASPHVRAGMDCASCHTIHGVKAVGAAGRALLPAPEPGSAGRLDGVSAACAEGILTCTSCHDPHGPSDRMRLAGFKQETCIDCHTDKGGPFVFEHGSARVDGCVACHTPHGSVNRHMLTFQATGELCYSCHALVPGFHLAGAQPRFGLDTNCTNCHSSIHGSNLDPFFLK